MKNQPDVTIIIPFYRSSLDPVFAMLSQQDYTGKITIIVLDDGPENQSAHMPSGVTYIKNPFRRGLAGNLNEGILLSKTDYVITLHQDCVPVGTDWLAFLMKPFADPHVVLSSSQSVLPLPVWKTFTFWHKLFSIPELSQSSVVHERATAYNRSVLFSCGLFNNKLFFTAGEDTDLFMKMRHHGKLVVSNALVHHIHAPHNDSLWKFMTTYIRCHEATGVLHRLYTIHMGFQFWYDLFKTVLFVFMVVFLFYNPSISLALFVVVLLLANFRYIGIVQHVLDLRLFLLPFISTFIWFLTLFVMWKGFLTGKQDLC